VIFFGQGGVAYVGHVVLSVRAGERAVGWLVGKPKTRGARFWLVSYKCNHAEYRRQVTLHSAKILNNRCFEMT